MPWIRKANWTPEDIKFLIEEQWTIGDIAEHYGLTRQRVHQICKKHNLPKVMKLKAERKAATYFARWGIREQTDLYNVCRQKFRTKKANAIRLGIPWTVTFGELQWVDTCPILGIPLNYFAEEREEGSPSFDRIDPRLGYVAGNVQIVSWRANRIKNDGSANEHRLIADYLDKHVALSNSVV